MQFVFPGFPFYQENQGKPGEGALLFPVRVAVTPFLMSFNPNVGLMFGKHTHVLYSCCLSIVHTQMSLQSPPINKMADTTNLTCFQT